MEPTVATAVRATNGVDEYRFVISKEGVLYRRNLTAPSQYVTVRKLPPDHRNTAWLTSYVEEKNLVILDTTYPGEGDEP